MDGEDWGRRTRYLILVFLAVNIAVVVAEVCDLPNLNGRWHLTLLYFYVALIYLWLEVVLILPAMALNVTMFLCRLKGSFDFGCDNRKP